MEQSDFTEQLRYVRLWSNQTRHGGRNEDVMTAKGDILKAISPLQLAYKSVLDKDMLQFYVEMLANERLNPLVLSKAVQKLILSNKFLPTIAEIVTQYKELEGYIKAKEAKSPLDAWDEVQRVIGGYGYEHGLNQIKDATAKKVASVMWRDLCYGSIDSVSVRRGQFLKLYTQEIEKTEQDKANAKLIADTPELVSYREKRLSENIKAISESKKI